MTESIILADDSLISNYPVSSWPTLTIPFPDDPL